MTTQRRHQQHSHHGPTRLQIAILAIACMGLFSARGFAEPVRKSVGAKSMAKLLQVAKATKMTHYVRNCDGVKRVYINGTAKHLGEVKDFTKAGSNVLEICHMSRGMHTEAIFDGLLLHFQYANVGGRQRWRMNLWGDTMRPSPHPLYSAMIQLTDKEATTLRTMIKTAALEQQGGRFVDKSFGQRGFNCTSAWSGAAIGEKGSSLAQIVGLGYASGSPHGFQGDLENKANDRVFGVCVYGPDLKDFDKNQTTQKFHVSN